MKRTVLRWSRTEKGKGESEGAKREESVVSFEVKAKEREKKNFYL